MALTLEEIRGLYREHGHVVYSGEPVTQLEHALQSGLLAEEAGADDALVAAAFLHDLGHLLNRQGETPSARGIDDLHQYYVLPFLRPLLPDAVLEPIRLHVDAKRCLCRTDAGYFESLSPDSVRSLALQGGVFSDEAAAAFLRRPFAEDALRLRRWGDMAKVEGKATPDLNHYMEIVARQVRRA
ncbi:phosphonate degradation HD-domain oxygenase [Burkholderia ubonensis]|uniref:phosphonate degradation HD-domain oxygenase n=1 Tax=Burkholderia ubonensis TaxID=101571 RepID=UPI000BA6B300|nr:phosphonate degradation HD-domain oxygenase [Burkholderia ubonensis]PAK11205.1 phosphohydrolase [Burkholderia ubonensis]RQP28711.1 phosphohydrolase [Burkholderia ubonensis]RQP33811.1 phosphohydrolase [Burkholderia ubonensis]RQP40022.1 phosphohydrolase [Burkholderia ubonensis]RQP53622.1 phosphohydrolase [Burkholderia ubonensis]